jgi:UDP-N-acetylglucosamine 1-carboxyvinyltransferase
MDKYVITGGNILKGTVTASGAKNAALKALVAACLTDEEVIIKNVPEIADVYVMLEIMKELGAKVNFSDNIVYIRMQDFTTHQISLEKAAQARTSSMFIAPLLARYKEAVVPNPGGCRLGARPIDRTIEGITHMNAEINYDSDDGYFHAKTSGLKGIDYTFTKNTHTGTETLILAAALASGMTTLHNAAEEPEIDDLISLLNAMGGNVKRTNRREITIIGVEKLHGTTYTISPDRNEVITFAIMAYVTKGDVFVRDAQKVDLQAFYEKLDQAGASYEKKDDGVRFYYKNPLKAVSVETAIYPGFMTDWQAPWAVLMTQAVGESVVHETVFENKLSYINDLKKMGASVHLFNPDVLDPEKVYNFNLEDNDPSFFHAVKITGPQKLHNAVVTMADIRAGAAVVLAALCATGESYILDVQKLDRGYEHFEERIQALGAQIKRIRGEEVLS